MPHKCGSNALLLPGCSKVLLGKNLPGKERSSASDHKDPSDEFTIIGSYGTRPGISAGDAWHHGILRIIAFSLRDH